jgi:hypothetical protein
MRFRGESVIVAIRASSYTLLVMRLARADGVCATLSRRASVIVATAAGSLTCLEMVPARLLPAQRAVPATRSRRVSASGAILAASPMNRPDTPPLLPEPEPESALPSKTALASVAIAAAFPMIFREEMPVEVPSRTSSRTDELEEAPEGFAMLSKVETAIVETPADSPTKLVVPKLLPASAGLVSHSKRASAIAAIHADSLTSTRKAFLRVLGTNCALLMF